MGIKKKRVYINLVGSGSGAIKGSKGKKGGRKPSMSVKPGKGRRP
jgi:hypothetical protein